MLLHLDTIRTWQLLAALVYRPGWLSFSAATIAILVLGICCGVCGGFAAYLGFGLPGISVVQVAGLHGEEVVAAGPYRWMRNPLYIGTFLHTLALALLMPPSGAVFCIIVVGSFSCG